MTKVGYQAINDAENPPPPGALLRAISTRSTMKSKSNSFFIILIVIVVVLLLAYFIYNGFTGDHFKIPLDKIDASMFDERGRYIMHNFDQAKPMSSFLAGLGGLWGIPMWAFYVNRGQGITSFGLQNKDNAIQRFSTADRAYQNTPYTGFRTFVRGQRGSKSFNHMPFHPIESDSIEIPPIRNMYIGMNEMEVEEVSTEFGLQTNALYFTIPNEDFPALIRQTTFSNLDTKRELQLDFLDGLTKLIPAGLSNGALDAMGRTMEAWMNVYNLGGEDGPTQPFYHISQGTADVAQVQIIKEGHFVMSFIQRDEAADETAIEPAELLPFIVDPDVVFGTDTTLTNPKNFFKSEHSTMKEFMSQQQGTTSRTPCAYTGGRVNIPTGGNVTITSIYGHAEDLDTFIARYSPRIRSNGFVIKKRSEANSLVDAITSKVSTKTGNPTFDLYVKQSFLDNILRGGLPILLGTNTEKPVVYHTFSRIHGDIERDYNFFQIDTTYFSQGPGNFRDVNQNRRLDVFHTPAVGTFNIEMFLAFVQADGYNPLTVATTNFKIRPNAINDLASAFQVQDTEYEAMKDMLTRPFRIGQLFKDMKTAGITSQADKNDIINQIVDASDQAFAGQFAQNGFWADHWTYTMDLVDSYLSIYPEKEQHLLYEINTIPFFFSPAVVKSRKNRYSLVPASGPNALTAEGTPRSTIRVYNAVSITGQADYPTERNTAMTEITTDTKYIGDSAGAGAIWQKSLKTKQTMTVSVIAKIFMLATLKFSTLDPMGMGVEQEGGKPGWNDAMNGLPGLVGSGMPETFEMLRLVKYLHKSTSAFHRSIVVPAEFGVFVDSIVTALNTFQQTASYKRAELESANFIFWDTVNTARELYRQQVMIYFSGETVEIPADRLLGLLTNMEAKVNLGIEAALATSTNPQIVPTYFHYDCTEYEITDTTTVPAQVQAKKFALNKLPAFLEGPTRHMKVMNTIEERRAVYQAVKSSSIYDKELEMFALSESLVGLSQEVGRMMAFTPGWLENQSIWLHMTYKFLLELLRGKLYDEFFQEMVKNLVPYLDSAVYGRSPLEAASFIVSSAFPDPKLHGTGFLARLSGSTAEFLSMWALMFAGHQPFQLDANKQLILKLSPILPGWFFDEKTSTVSFTFLGTCQVTYHNPSRKNTWEIERPSYIVVTDSAGSKSRHEEPVLDAGIATRARQGGIVGIDVYYE